MYKYISVCIRESNETILDLYLTQVWGSPRENSKIYKPYKCVYKGVQWNNPRSLPHKCEGVQEKIPRSTVLISVCIRESNETILEL